MKALEHEGLSTTGLITKKYEDWIIKVFGR